MEIEPTDADNNSLTKQQYGVWAAQKKIAKTMYNPTLGLIATLVSTHTAYTNYPDSFASFSSAGNVLNTSGCTDPTVALATANESIFSCLRGILYLNYLLLVFYATIWLQPPVQYMALFDSNEKTRKQAQEFFDGIRDEGGDDGNVLCILLPLMAPGLGFWFGIFTLIPLGLEMSRIGAISQSIINDNTLCQPTLTNMLAYYSASPTATCALNNSCSVRTHCIISLVFNCGGVVYGYWSGTYGKAAKKYKIYCEQQDAKKKVHINEMIR